jgi:hypothetical protein
MQIFLVTQYVINETRIIGACDTREKAERMTAYAREVLKNFNEKLKDFEAIYEIREIEADKVKIWEAYSHDG